MVELSGTAPESYTSILLNVYHHSPFTNGAETCTFKNAVEI
jgi:hypothetical protein